MYKDSEYENLIEDAINKAIANLSLEGFIVSEEEKDNLKKEFLENYEFKILVKKNGEKNGKRQLE